MCVCYLRQLIIKVFLLIKEQISLYLQYNKNLYTFLYAEYLKIIVIIFAADFESIFSLIKKCLNKSCKKYSLVPKTFDIIWRILYSQQVRLSKVRHWRCLAITLTCVILFTVMRLRNFGCGPLAAVGLFRIRDFGAAVQFCIGGLVAARRGMRHIRHCLLRMLRRVVSV